MSNTQNAIQSVDALTVLQDVFKTLAPPPDLSGVIKAIRETKDLVSPLETKFKAIDTLLGTKFDALDTLLGTKFDALDTLLGGKFNDVLKAIEPSLADKFLTGLGAAASAVGIVAVGAGTSPGWGTAALVGGGVAGMTALLEFIENGGAIVYKKPPPERKNSTPALTGESVFRLYKAGQDAKLNFMGTNTESNPLYQLKKINAEILQTKLPKVYVPKNIPTGMLPTNESPLNFIQNNPLTNNSFNDAMYPYNKSLYSDMFATNKSDLDLLKPFDTSSLTQDITNENLAITQLSKDLIIPSRSNSAQAKSSTVHNITNHIYNIDKVDVADGIITDLEEFFSAIKRKAQEARYDLSS